MRVDAGRIDLERLLGSAMACGGLSSASALRRPEQRRHPARIVVQRRLERLRIASVLLCFSRNNSPQAVLIAASPAARRSGVAIRGVRLLEATEGAQRARARGPVPSALVATSAIAATRARIGSRLGAAEHLQQQPELERRVAGRRALGNRPQRCFSFLISAARDRRAGVQRRDGRILRIQLVRRGRRPRRSGPRSGPEQLLRGRDRRPAARLRDRDRDERQENERCRERERIATPHHLHIISDGFRGNSGLNGA